MSLISLLHKIVLCYCNNTVHIFFDISAIIAYNHSKEGAI